MGGFWWGENGIYNADLSQSHADALFCMLNISIREWKLEKIVNQWWVIILSV